MIARRDIRWLRGVAPMRLLTGIVLVAIAACGDGRSTAFSTSTDSAGVRIVTSTAPVWGATGGWQVDTTPLLSIGDAIGPNPVLLVEVNGVRLLSNGHIAVVNGSEHEVRYFDSKGNAAGRTGRSDTDAFRSVSLVGNSGDSLLLWDAELDHATLLDPGGRVVRSFSLTKRDTSAATRLGYAPAALFGDGTLLLAARSGAATGEQSGLRRDTIPLRRADAFGVIGVPIASVPGSEALAIITKKFVSRFERPFGQRTVIGAQGANTLVGTGDIDGLTVYDSTGKLAAYYRVDRPRRSIPESDIAALGFRQGRQLQQLPPDFAAVFRRVLTEVGVPGTLPTTYQLVVDATGAIWLRDDVGPVLRDSIPQRWTVLSATGAWLGAVTTPRRFEVHQITADRVVGVQRDENDVEYVRVFRLRR